MSIRRRLMMAKKEPIIQQIEVIKPTIITNVYIKDDGTQASYNGWAASDFIDITGFNFAYSYHNVNYWSLYDHDKKSIGRVTINDGRLSIPPNASFLRYSGSAAEVTVSDVILSTVKLLPITLSADSNNMYINQNGAVVVYNGWNTFKVDQLEGYQGVYQYSTQRYNASYNSNGSPVTKYRGYLPIEDNISYVLFSFNAATYKVYLIPQT